eukprot:TRINITY_DN62032_c0_g1_i1.p1 TRINITY_DN62032_c0_g1~~TRINITY_DN62032_c0_g1_i1.p1  ORF type:complete len:441 (-),score=46.04 TRINITY_DN62032_c0_g1_i1:138-1460(-)
MGRWHAPTLLIVATIDSAIATCESDIDCSLNGICNDGRCTCDVAWGGDRCQFLELMPAAKENGYKQEGRSSWGGSVIRDGGMYHMFVEELVNECGLNTYGRNMRIARATSSSASGPYKPVDLVTNYSASTPHAVRDPNDGSWLVFITGCGDMACLAVDKCRGGITSADADMEPCPPTAVNKTSIVTSERSRAHARVGHASPCTCPKPGHNIPGKECSVDWGTNVLRATSPSGPWQLTAPLLDIEHPAKTHEDGTPWVFANPSALVLSNNETFLMYRDFLQNLQFPATNVIGLAVSNNGWVGPYTRFTEKIVPNFAEDPHIYMDARGNLHMIAHSLCVHWPDCPAVGGHAASPDGGATWYYSGEAAYNTSVEYEDGSTVTYSRRERPEMMLNEANEITHLITGVVEPGGGGQADRSWTLVQPVRTGRRGGWPAPPSETLQV